MSKRFSVLIFAFFCLAFSSPSRSQQFSSAVVWSEPGLPSADSAVPASAQLASLFPGARIASADQLAAQLETQDTHLLILPQGSVVPEAAWPPIFRFLDHGGNLLVLGGRPFTRSAYRDDSGWHLRDYSLRFPRLLLIDQYQETPGSDNETFTPNPDFHLSIPRFSWQQAFSPIIRLSTKDLYNRGGSTGTLDVRLDPLVWGVKDGRRLSSPLMEFDHLTSGFDGGRWIFLSAQLPPNFYDSPAAATLVRALAVRALQGAEEFSVRPTLPLYLPGEPVQIETTYHSFNTTKSSSPLRVEISIYPEAHPSDRRSATLQPGVSTTEFPPASGKGLHIVEARLFDGDSTRAVYHSAFWIRDLDFLNSGPRLGVNADYFTLDSKPLAVVGTTYMSSEVQRLYFDHPNVYVWNSDLAQIRGAGLNMLRTGWWTGWDKFCDENGHPYERTLRTLEAYLMTARKNGLPVQFNFFAFLPEVLGGRNAYLDPQAVRKQQTLVGTVTSRFHGVPFVAWDLVNEPSFSQHLWTMRPNGDPLELEAWNAWLAKKYPDRAALAAQWHVPPDSVSGVVSIPDKVEFTGSSLYQGKNALRAYDFYLFAQDMFSDWVHGMREVIRSSGSNQPITVGQDEGGYQDRLSPAFFGPYVDFTTNHSWWHENELLWDSLVAKQPGLAMLIQETGVGHALNPDGLSRLTAGQEAAIFERKIALSFAGGSGAIEWLWNTNAYMSDGGEVALGGLRADATEKPEADVLRSFAQFAIGASPFLQNPKRPDIAIVTSQAAQFSTYAGYQLEAQQNSVRALAYWLHRPAYVIAEAQIAKLGAPQLVILPSAQALKDSTWQALLAYVRNGGHLLVTGPVSRDEHWRLVDRMSPLGLSATTLPLRTRVVSSSNAPGAPSMTFDPDKQHTLEVLHFADGTPARELTLGTGTLFWDAYPVELAEGPQAAASSYSRVLNRLQLKKPFELSSTIPDGVLAFPVELENGVLYVLESESNLDADLSIHDNATGADFKWRLPAQRAAVVVLDRKSKQLVAKYDLPDLN